MCGISLQSPQFVTFQSFIFVHVSTKEDILCLEQPMELRLDMGSDSQELRRMSTPFSENATSSILKFVEWCRHPAQFLGVGSHVETFWEVYRLFVDRQVIPHDCIRRLESFSVTEEDFIPLVIRMDSSSNFLITK